MEECSICTEPTNICDFNTLPCNHKLCKDCFPKIRKPVCPFCRSPYGDTNDQLEEDIDIHIFIDFEVDPLVRFLTPRQRRRQRRNRRSRQRAPSRQVVQTIPLDIINIDDLEIVQSEPQKRGKKKKKTKRVKNEKKRVITSNNYNDLRNQQNIF